MFESREAARAVYALIAVRLVYAVNWLNVGAIFFLMGMDIGGGVGGLGALTSAFYLGLGIFQVPGGILSAAWGPKRVVWVGVIASSLAVIGTALSTGLLESAVFRFVVGAGMAFVFSPAVVIVTKLITGQKSGLGTGLYNSAFDVGGLAGLFAWVVIADFAGWRESLLLSGGLGLFTGLLVIFIVPRESKSGEFGGLLQPLLKILGDPRLLVVGLGTLGTDIGVSLSSSFVVYYLTQSLGSAAALAGFIGSFIFSTGIISAIWGGRIYDKVRNPRLLIGASNSFVALGLLLFSSGSVALVAAASVLIGGTSGIAFTVAFAAAKDLNRSGEAFGSLAVAWVNCLGLFGSFWPPILFSYLVGGWGYGVAWAAGAALIMGFTAPLVLARFSSRT